VPTLMIQKALRRRLDTLARRVGLSTTALGNLLLEAALNAEERRFAREQRAAKDLEAILVRVILRGDDDPATSVTHERSVRSGPPSSHCSTGGGHESTALHHATRRRAHRWRSAPPVPVPRLCLSLWAVFQTWI
jgi:hypothetical protein